MTITVTIEEAAANLERLISGLVAGDEAIITKDQQIVARLVAEAGPRRSRSPRPAPGFGKGSVLYMAPDFNAPMEEFKEYME